MRATGLDPLRGTPPRRRSARPAARVWVTCRHCGETHTAHRAPALEDAAGWEAVAVVHAEGCPWVVAKGWQVSPAQLALAW
jgi:hypothetical protein